MIRPQAGRGIDWVGVTTAKSNAGFAACDKEGTAAMKDVEPFEV